MAEDDQASGLTYHQAGVDIDAGTALIQRVGNHVAATHRPGVLGGLGGFGGLFELPVESYRRPVLVSGTDGVGTKLELAIQMDRHAGIGIDLVAMCVNDVIVSGAEPLFFLDYYATGRLDVDVAATVIQGIATGCREAGAALIGGETAEMPGLYAASHYDLAGFCVGIAERDELIDGSGVGCGDVLIGVGSSGAHANGFSLIRRVIAASRAALGQPLGDTTLGEQLLTPTRIYVEPIRRVRSEISVRGLCHITGGGLPENLPRTLPVGLAARIDTASWEWPEVFAWLQQHGRIATAEMYRTFNCGVGMVVIVRAEDAEHSIAVLRAAGETAWRLGAVEAAAEGSARVRFSDPPSSPGQHG